jgi:hypothetical protein
MKFYQPVRDRFSGMERRLALVFLLFAIMCGVVGCAHRTPPQGDTAAVRSGVGASDAAAQSAQRHAADLAQSQARSDGYVRDARRDLDTADHKEAVLGQYFQWLQTHPRQ